MAFFELLHSKKLISHKISVTEKILKFYAVPLGVKRWWEIHSHLKNISWNQLSFSWFHVIFSLFFEHLISRNFSSIFQSPHQVTHLVDTDNPSQLQEDLNKNNYNNSSNSISSTSNSGRKRKESTVTPDALLSWLAKQVETYEKVIISDMTTSFQNGLALCAIIHR